MELLKASEYRQLFLEKIGFPLIRANAVRFVPNIGDLRKVENLKRVYDAALQWCVERKEKEDFWSDRALTLESELEQLKHEIKALKEEKTEMLDKVKTLAPEEALATYLAEVPEEIAEAVISVVIVNKESYREIAKVLHPDTTPIKKQKAEALIKIANRIHEINSKTSSLHQNHGFRESQPETVSQGYKNEWGLDDIPF